MSQPIDGRSRELFEDKNFCHVAVIDEDGSPFVVVTWVDIEDGRLVLNTADGRAWPAMLRRDPRVTLTVTNMENPYEYVRVRGRVDEETRDGADEHIDRMAKKYLGEDKYPFRQEGEVRVIFRIDPERVTHVGG